MRLPPRCVLSGSLNEPDGADRKGGGNGLGGRLAKRAMPVSKRKGGSRGGCAVEEAMPSSASDGGGSVDADDDDDNDAADECGL